MSKRNSDGDVLTNKLNLALANSQRRLAAMLGSQPESQASTTTSQLDDEDEDLKKNYADPEQLGVGGMRPKDIEDGGFTKRTITSSDKLLEQLIGKKKTRAHLAAKQNATRLSAKSQQQRYDGLATTKNEESEDEEEGRAAVFRSKKRKVVQPKPKTGKDDIHESKVEPPKADEDDPNGTEEAQEAVIKHPSEKEEDKDTLLAAAALKSMPSRGKSKATSFLDEILAERSKKKKKKAKTKAVTKT